MIDTKDPALKMEGMSVDEARAAAEAKGCLLRVVKEDGRPMLGTCDFRPNRCNVEVTGGKVTTVESWG